MLRIPDFAARFAAIALVLTSFAGCAVGVGPGRVIEEEQVFPADGKALVIVGLALTTDESFSAGWGASWLQIDRGSQSVVKDGASMGLVRHSCSVFKTHPNGCNDDQRIVLYFPVIVEPGDYMLSALWDTDDGSTHFIRPEGSLFANVANGMKSGAVPWFSIEAGEILYIGDMIVSIFEENRRIVEFRRSDDGARAMLSGYPNVRGELIFRPVNGDKLVVATE